MKAKEYIEKYKGVTFDTLESVDELFKEFILDSKSIIDIRRINTDKGLVSVMMEFDQKWKAICRGLKGLNPDGYYEFWKHSKDGGIDFRLMHKKRLGIHK